MLETLIAGGPVMIPIALCSVVALAVFLERLWALRRDQVLPRAYTVELLDHMTAGRIDEARTHVKTMDAAVSRLATVALDAAGEPRSQLKERLEEVGRREAAELERGIPVVGTIASIAPLLGLLGTVGGMIDTFDVIQNSGLGDVGNLAGGISIALITTFAGLSVGIPAVVGNRFLLSRVDGLLVDLEELAISFVDALAEDDDEAVS